jgi:uncharacterized protein
MPTIIFKPTEKCNSNCIYCDVIVKKSPKTMPIGMLELVFKKIDEYLQALPEERMTLIWHGGEPCLLGVDYYKKALEFQDAHCSLTKSRIDHAMQSNLTLITQELVDVFRQLGIDQIGTSYEPIPHTRGFGKNRDSEAYNRGFMDGINLLNENGMGWGIIYVVTRRSLQMPLDIFYFLTNLKPGFVLNPVLVYEGEDFHGIGITPLEFADFLGAIFPVWWKTRHRYPEVDPFRSMLRNVSEGARHLGCGDSGECAFSHSYIGPSGEASHCGRAGDWSIVSYGNIQERSLMEIFSDEQRRQFGKRNEVLPQSDCKDCRFWGICHGGCPLDAYNKHKDFMHKTEWCGAKRVFIEKYFEPITGLSAQFGLNTEQVT